jgi:trehalose 6-phosphate phosphatase
VNTGERSAELVATIRADLPGALIALDFDGTLAPIVTDPEDSRPIPGVIDALVALAERGAHIAIVTGRDATTVIRLGGLDAVPGISVAGLYGAQTWSDGALQTPDVPESITRLRTALPGVLADAGADPDVWIEDKGLSLVVHARRAADPDAALAPLDEPVRALAATLELEVHPGRDVLELRIPGHDKGTAITALVERWQPTSVLFAGDDLGDLPGFARVRELRAGGLVAWAVGARSPEVPDLAGSVDLEVDGPGGVLALLEALGR